MDTVMLTLNFLAFIFASFEYDKASFIEALERYISYAARHSSISVCEVRHWLRKQLIAYNWDMRENRRLKAIDGYDPVPLYKPEAEEKVISIVTAYLYITKAGN